MSQWNHCRSTHRSWRLTIRVLYFSKTPLFHSWKNSYVGKNIKTASSDQHCLQIAGIGVLPQNVDSDFPGMIESVLTISCRVFNFNFEARFIQKGKCRQRFFSTLWLCLLVVSYSRTRIPELFSLYVCWQQETNRIIFGRWKESSICVWLLQGTRCFHSSCVWGMAQHAGFGHQSTLQLTQIPQDLLLQLILPVYARYMQIGGEDVSFFRAPTWSRLQVVRVRFQFVFIILVGPISPCFMCSFSSLLLSC